MEKTLKRIDQTERILDRANRVIDRLDRQTAAYEKLQGEIKKLESYYTSDDWKNDFRLDEEGGLPAELKRGVLSEDGIYDLLEKNDRMKKRLNAGEGDT